MLPRCDHLRTSAGHQPIGAEDAAARKKADIKNAKDIAAWKEREAEARAETLRQRKP